MKHETPIDLWLYEKEAFTDGFQLVCGVDEAGRGPLAGPVCAAAVILPPELVIPGLNDSKKLTDKKRRELCSVITAEAVSYGIAFASEQEIDEINILQATFLAMERAMAQLAPPPELALIDGNRSKDFGLPIRTIVKGDSLSASIAAASILAKVTRDRLMEQYDEQYPQYGFAVHKGYGTKRHYAALREYGVAAVVGEQTCGKGYFQNTYQLSDGSAVGLSVGKYYTPKGENLAGVGITPDVSVPVDEQTAAGIYYGTLPPEDDPQLQAALKVLTDR